GGVDTDPGCRVGAVHEPAPGRGDARGQAGGSRLLRRLVHSLPRARPQHLHPSQGAPGAGAVRGPQGGSHDRQGRRRAGPAPALPTRVGGKGVPTVLFLTPEGNEVPDTRVVGFLPPSDFAARAARAASAASVAARPTGTP